MSATMKSWNQDAHEKILYKAVVSGDTIISATASILPVGPVLGAVATTATTATLMVSGLTAGVRYVLKVFATCVSGQVLQAECSIMGE